jgi:pectinesterase
MNMNRRGWVAWDRADERVTSTVYYGEYANRGPGANTSARVSWFHAMNSTEAETYTVQRFISGHKWLNATGVEYQPGLI